LALRETLRRIMQLAADVRADAVLCGGDLYEHERFSPDTAQFLRTTFAEATPLPVYLAPGNHDWFGPESLYHQVSWTPNVHVFTEDRLSPVALDDGLILWGAAHRAPANTDGFLDAFHVDRGGVHVALFHGSERSWFGEQESGKAPHAPFSADQIPAAGLHHAFLGHFHRPRDAEHHTYPGNPDPLSFGEDGERAAVVATVGPDGSVERERHVVAVTRAHDLRVDVTGCASLQEIGACVSAAARGRSGVARITLEGTLGASVDLKLADLYGFVRGLDAVTFRAGKMYPDYDFQAIALEPTVRGTFVQDVLKAEGLDPDDLRSILTIGLRALDGRADLEVV
jgi:DNA repair exonuclease SbcCD nuclease subunit